MSIIIEGLKLKSGQISVIKLGIVFIIFTISSTGRWHAIPARRIEIRKELRGRVHSFAVSVIPIKCGVFEFTARTRAPKSGNTEWIWGAPYQLNETIRVTRTAFQRYHFTQGAIRQLAQWFDTILMKWYVSELYLQEESRPHRNALTAYL